MLLHEYKTITAELDLQDWQFLCKNHEKHISVKPINDSKYILNTKSYIGKIILPSRKEITIKPKIDINNLLYIISYTYDIVNFNYSEKRKLTKNEALVDIYIIVFLNWLELLFKKGLFKDYQLFTHELSALKGKIKINESFVKREKLVCEYSDLSFSNVENNIIKSTLLFIINHTQLGHEERKRALLFYRRLANLNSVQLSAAQFKQVNINRLNKHYKPIIELCELIFNNLRLSDDNGKLFFSSFMVNMNIIYEHFLLRALQKRLKTEHVEVKKSRKTNWAESSDNLLPLLETDIHIKGKAIADAKYYKSPLTNNGKFINSHIYQIITYLKAYNLSNGFLIYPEPETGKVDSLIKMKDINFTIFTIPLNRKITDLNSALDILTKKIISKIPS